MFSHRGLFLAVTISLASIALAGILVQPGYEHQYNSHPRYSQSVSRHWIRSSTEQYRAEQLPDQESTRYLPGVQTTEKNEDPKEVKRKRMEESRRRKQFTYHMGGGRALQSLMIHNRMKRSPSSDPASTESSKSKIVAHDNDVAAKSPLTDVKHPTAIDLLKLFSELEPTDANDKARMETYGTSDNFTSSIFEILNSTFLPVNITFSEYEPTDTNDKRAENCPTKYNFILSILPFLGSNISSTNITSPKHEPTDANDKRVENCQTEKNFILSILPFLKSTISSANIGFPDTLIHFLTFAGATIDSANITMRR